MLQDTKYVVLLSLSEVKVSFTINCLVLEDISNIQMHMCIIMFNREHTIIYVPGFETNKFHAHLDEA
jgi:hypothetical protein